MPPRLVDVENAARGEVRPFREAIIALTGEVRGEIEPCGCPTTPYGGFSRRARLLDELRTWGPPLFVVDAGEMLVKGSTSRDDADRLERARTVLDLAGATGLDAWAPSPSDRRVLGSELLASPTALSANWRDEGGGDLIARATRVVRGGVTLGIIGLSAEGEGVESADAVSSVREAMTGEADAWVVISNAEPAVAQRVAEEVAGLAAVLSTSGDVLQEPRTTRLAPIVETPDRGRYVSLVHLFLGSTPGPVEVVGAGPWKDLAGARQRKGPTEPDARVAWDAALARTRARVESDTAGRNIAFITTVPLAGDLDGDSSVDARIAAFRERVLGAARTVAQQDAGPRYATAGGCAGCHYDRFAQWLYDPHARAHEALQKDQKTQDPECIGCHTTGFARPGGFAELSAAKVETYKGVQCEACHGPMKGHDGTSPVHSQPIDDRTCRACHDEANSPQYDPVAYAARISCARMRDNPDDPANVTPKPERRPSPP